jgi:hypothetical protein
MDAIHSIEQLFENEMKLHYNYNIRLSYDALKFDHYVNMIQYVCYNMLYKDIYLVLLFVYYTLVVNEPTEDWLTIHFLENSAIHKQKSMKLFWILTTRNLMVCDIDISSEIRRYMFGFA